MSLCSYFQSYTFYILLYCSQLAANGKRIGEVADKLNGKFNFDQAEPVLFQWN
jgi:hypothetical protein